MSNKMHANARLRGHEGPFFPPLLRVIHALNATGQFGSTGGHLEKLGNKVVGFFRDQNVSHDVKTSDGHEWHWALSFNRDGGVVRMCFPYGENDEHLDGTGTKRHLAIYTQGDVSPETIDEFLEEFLKQLYLWIARSEAANILHRVLEKEYHDSKDPAKTAPKAIKDAFEYEYKLIGKPVVEPAELELKGKVTVIIDGKRMPLEISYVEDDGGP